MKPVTVRGELPPGFPSNLSLGIADSPLKVDRLLPWLARYPDREAAEFLSHGLIHGFSLNADLQLAHVHFENLASALNNPDIVHTLLAKEIKSGRISGPFPSPPFSMRVSPLGVIPKSQDETLAQLLSNVGQGLSLPGESAIMSSLEEDISQYTEFRMIFVLSAHDQWGQSVNSTTAEQYRSVHYTSFDEVVDKVSLLRPGSRCSKSDVKSAFRIIKLDPRFFQLTGMQYNGWFYLDRCMPFGSSTAPYTWEAFAKFFNWLVIQISGDPRLEHMLDDFFAYGPDDCAVNGQMSVFHSVADEMGVPINFDKYTPSTHRICFLVSWPDH